MIIIMQRTAELAIRIHKAEPNNGLVKFVEQFNKGIIVKRAAGSYSIIQ